MKRCFITICAFVALSTRVFGADFYASIGIRGTNKNCEANVLVKGPLSNNQNTSCKSGEEPKTTKVVSTWGVSKVTTTYSVKTCAPGYVFEGWFASAAGGSAKSTDDPWEAESSSSTYRITYYAQFNPISIGTQYTSATIFVEGNPSGVASSEVFFTTNADNINDFAKVEFRNTKGAGTFANAKIERIDGGKVYVSYTYTAAGVHGDNVGSADLYLYSAGGESSAYIVISANVDLTPHFSLSFPVGTTTPTLDFGEVLVSETVSTTDNTSLAGKLKVIPTNEVAKQSNVSWQADVVNKNDALAVNQYKIAGAEENNPHRLTGDAVKNCNVIFAPEQHSIGQVDDLFTVTLRITASYTCEGATDPLTATQEVTLQGKAVLAALYITQTEGSESIDAYAYTDPVIGTNRSADAQFFVSQKNVESVQCMWLDKDKKQISKDTYFNIQPDFDNNRFSVFVQPSAPVEVLTRHEAYLVLYGLPKGLDTKGLTKEDIKDLAAKDYIRLSVILEPRKTPEITWNWATLYEGSTTTTPQAITPKVPNNSTGAWTIRSLDESVATINADRSVTTGYFYHIEKTVDFLITQEADATFNAASWTQTARVVKRLDAVPFTINDQTVFDAVKHTSDNVSYIGSSKVQFAAPSATFTMQFQGMPETLSFTPAGNSTWTISESSDGNSWQNVQSAATLSGAQSYPLSKATRYVKFVVSGSSAVTAENIAVSEYTRIEVPEPELQLLVYEKTVHDVSTHVFVSKVAELTATLQGTDAGLFRLQKSGSGTTTASLTFTATDGLGQDKVRISLPFVVKYIGTDVNEAIGKKASILLKDSEGNTQEINVSVVQAPAVKYEPADGGTYHVTYADGQEFDVTTTAQQRELVYGVYGVKLSAPKPETGYKFFAWCSIDDNNEETLLSYDEEFSTEFRTAVRVTAKFVSSSRATFVVKGESTPYIDLQRAIDRAAQSSSKVVVVQSSGSVPAGTYTIPASVTLLVPRDNDYTVNTAVERQAITAGQSFFRTLTLETGAVITANGSICVNAAQAENKGYPVGPMGRIIMSDNAEIRLNSGANLYVWGFITGSAKSTITAESGATIWEDFQLADWRGGSATITMLKNKKGVFFVNQYYIQNIETPLVFKYGATEMISTSVVMSEKGYSAEVKFIGSSDAMFCLQGETAYLVKRYDETQDRQVYEVYGNAKIDGVTMTLIGRTINTRDYVMPITTNMLVYVHSGKTSITSDIAFLPDTKVQVDKGAILEIATGAKVYVYDDAEKTITVDGKEVGYFGAGNVTLVTVPYRATNKFTRKTVDIQDAQMDVNGELVVNGELYTTAGGANICSSLGEGRVLVNAIGNSTTTYQGFQKSNTIGGRVFSTMDYYEISVTPAVLRNQDGTTEATKGHVGDVYTFYTTAGRWLLPRATVKSAMDQNVSLRLPQDDAVVIKVPFDITGAGDNMQTFFSGELSNVADFSFAKGSFENSVEWAPKENKLYVSLSYQPKKIHGKHTTTLRLTDIEAHLEQEPFATIMVDENYTPEFSVANTLYNATTPAGTPIESAANYFKVTPMAGTTATLSTTAWQAEIDGADKELFTIDQSDIKNVRVTFSPQKVGAAEAMLLLMASFEDEVGNTISYQQLIPLRCSATTPDYKSNTLQFIRDINMFVDSKGVSIFENQNNQTDIIVTFEPEGILKWEDNALTALGRTGEVLITAVQSDDNDQFVEGITISQQVVVQKHSFAADFSWQWGDVYGHQSYNNPFGDVPNSGWTLEIENNPNNLLDYDANQLHVRNINSGKVVASFTLTQPETAIYGSYTHTYTTTIHPDPCVLPIRIAEKNTQEFGIIASGSGKNISFSESTHQVSMGSGQDLILNFIGIPAELSFSTTSAAAFTFLEQTAAGKWLAIATEAISKQDNLYTVQLSPTAVAVRISVNEDATLSDITITETKSYSRNTYYGMATAIVASNGGGSVRAIGSEELEDSKYAEFSSSRVSAHGNFGGLGSDAMAFTLQALPDAGYYFARWETVGQTMVGDIDWSSSLAEYYQLTPQVKATILQQGYQYHVYTDYLYRNLHPDIWERAQQGNASAQQQVRDGAIELIPFTSIGTWQAHFALAQVKSADNEQSGNLLWNTVDGTEECHSVGFTVAGDDGADFVATLSSYDNGFAIPSDYMQFGGLTGEDKFTHSVGVQVCYTPQYVHGTHTVNLRLARVAVDGITEASYKDVTLTAIENLKPDFNLASSVSFDDGQLLTLGQNTIIDITPADKNHTASVQGAKLQWNAKVYADADCQTELQDIFLLESEPSADGTCRVSYSRKQAGNNTAYLQLVATYIDAKGNKIESDKKVSMLTGSCNGELSANNLKFSSDELIVDVDDVPFDPFVNRVKDNPSPINISGLPVGVKYENGLLHLNVDGLYTAGEYNITATQAANDYYASATCSAKLVIRKRQPMVHWNWNNLYWGTSNSRPISSESEGKWTLTMDDQYKVISSFDKAADSNDGYVAVVSQNTQSNTGVYDVKFTFSQQEYQQYDKYTAEYTAHVGRDPRRLTIAVDQQETYEAVTEQANTGSSVSYDTKLKAIRFAYKTDESYDERSWVVSFVGIPDELSFTPTGDNTWQIEEGPNSANLSTTTYAAAHIEEGHPFVLSLLPTTRTVRIRYGYRSGNKDGVLNKFQITELKSVKSDVDYIYLPSTDGASRDIQLTYANQGTLSVHTSSPVLTINGEQDLQLQATGQDAYGTQAIKVRSTATVGQVKYISVVDAEGNELLKLPVETYQYPQPLPIQLAIDDIRRFYFITTETNYAEWIEGTRAIRLMNVPANTGRSFITAFEGNPSVMSFRHNGVDGRWSIYQSRDGVDWSSSLLFEGVDPTGNVKIDNIDPATRYIKVSYTSQTSDVVDITDFLIVGNANVVATPAQLTFAETQCTQELQVQAINLAKMDIRVEPEESNFALSHNGGSTYGKQISLTETDYPGVLGNGRVGIITLSVKWDAVPAVEYGNLIISNPDDNNRVLAVVSLMGKRSRLTVDNAEQSGIYTGVAKGKQMEGTKGYTAKEQQYQQRRQVDLSHTFAGGKALFDTLYVYGETTTSNQSAIITKPTSQLGSNAVTPCYVYGRASAEDSYELVRIVENANSSTKVLPMAVSVKKGDKLGIYMTGYCPYASTGYTINDEGVWLFRGDENAQLDLYLENCQIYSRSKTQNGHTFRDREDAESFGDKFVRGSGGVLVFECSATANTKTPYMVNIHTRGDNMLKSHYGCFYQVAGVGRAFQVSSPIQVHLTSYDNTATTHLTFDDIWQKKDGSGIERTNGFLSLQKQANNAPSIDLGSRNTVVNFKGGRVELQNAMIGSQTYKTNMAISYRSGKFSGIDMALGMGTDEADGGIVNFYDGTTSVIPMTVPEEYRQYYLMDTDNPSVTSCLRCPEHTYVYGGSHCFMRACKEVTSKGGAPSDGTSLLGQLIYQYDETKGDQRDNATGLVNVNFDNYPGDRTKDGQTLAAYQEQYPEKKYGISSITTDDEGKLYFWIPEGFDESVKPEKDQKMSFWKTVMTEISAEYSGFRRSVGGNATIEFENGEQNEQISNFLYCKIDDNIHSIIDNTEKPYAAPVKNPVTGGFIDITPSSVGEKNQYYVSNKEDYQVNNKLYYITTVADADVWMTFVAPFDVDNIYVVETFDENQLSAGKSRDAILKLQAKNNADFASFFGVTIALDGNQPFDAIYDDYITWAMAQDQYTGGRAEYTLRGMQKLEYFRESNWLTANYYLFHNTADWTIKDADNSMFETHWECPKYTEGESILKQGEVYSMLFPYCMGCDVEFENGKVKLDENGDKIVKERTYWDYWSGKFLIFEGHGPQKIYGSTELEKVLSQATGSGEQGEFAILSGNSTFAQYNINGTEKPVFFYTPSMAKEAFYREEESRPVEPTTAFLMAQVPNNQAGMPARRINMQTGEIIYDKSNVTTDNGKHTPTVSGGADMFITTTEDGIRIAVRDPQHVRVYSSDGALVFDGYIDTSVDVALHTAGIYVVRGEQEVQKIMVH